MKTHRRYWVFFLLFLFSGIAYLDRVNMSVAGKPIAHEFGLSPVALGYLFSSFLWAYVLMMLPGGRLIDRWGTHVMAPIAAAVWSAAQMATGMVGNFAMMLIVRLGIGIGEAPHAPISYGSVRAWSPYTERGTAIAAISGGSSLGLALGAPAVAWLIDDAVMALVLHHHRRGRLCLGRGLVRTGFDARKNPLAAASRARTHSCRAHGRHRAAEPQRCRLSRADPLSGDVGSVHLSGLPRLHGLSVHFLAAELPADRTASVDAQLRHLHGDSVSHRSWRSVSWPIGLATGC